MTLFVKFNWVVASLVVFIVVFLSSGTVFGWTGPSSSAPNGNVSAPVNVGSTDQVKSATLGVNGLAVFGNSLLQAASYLNWGSTSGTWGYGIRDNAGTLEFKNSGGSWASLQSVVYSLTGGASSWTTSGTNIYNSNSGNVGIGTSGPTQKLDVAGNITAPLYYDRDNTGYYLNPNGTSRLNYPYVDNLYSYSTTYLPFIYDTNNTGYYLDPNGTSVTNVLYSYGGIVYPNGGTQTYAMQPYHTSCYWSYSDTGCYTSPRAAYCASGYYVAGVQTGQICYVSNSTYTTVSHLYCCRSW